MDKNPTIFEFSSYKFEPEKKRVSFSYKQEFDNSEPLNFTETIILPEIPGLNHIPAGLLEKLFQGLHLVLGISYYKFYCATIVRHNYLLTEWEANFWNMVYKKGLGEFFYKNNLDPKISPKFSFDKSATPNLYSLEKNEKCLVAVSGGKDSIVSLELLKERGIDITAVFTETQKKSSLVDKILELSGVESFKVQRFLDWQTFQEHKYNGHIPISAIYAFLAIFYAVLYKYSYFVISNEYSSNFGNIKYKGETINHQWSKSSEFENLFSDYIKNFVTPDVRYFSLLRPFYEIRIAKMFSQYKKYFPYFSSCNQNFKINKKEGGGLWCGQCAKCTFVFTLLSAFLPKKELLDIFKKNLYQDEKLVPMFRDILGFGKMKPFDCVGTFDETRAALYLAAPKFKNDLIIKTFLTKIKNPQKIVKEVFKTNPSPNVPPKFKFLGMESALILGYGKEGEVSKKYLKKEFPNLKIAIADEKLDKKYLTKQNDFDIAIKTPGIPKDLVKIPYTTATNIFLSNVIGKNKIVGVTGSKGKSTTASLIFAILKEAGKDVELLGNIGNPMLEALLKPIKNDTIFVLELSSYQLDDIEFSPNIAVITNLFPEHMDYHSGLKNYYSAKKNIVNFQNKTGVFVYNPKNKELTEWAKNSNGKSVPFTSDILLCDKDIPLLGEHNRENIKAAITATQELGISDEIIKDAVKKFKGLPHRLEFLGEFKKIKFYDDAISTTPESTIMAIKTLKDVDTIFLGGEDRGYKFSQLEKTIKKYKIKNVVLFPESGKRILKSQNGFNVLRTKNMAEAVKFAYKHTTPGKICLLSCASPSYSLWKNFEEKGDQFKKFVKELSK